MNTRASAWLAFSLAGLSVALFLASVVVYVLVRSSQEGPSTSGALGELLIFDAFLAFPIVGALIASRHPKNPVGWICLAIGLFWMEGSLEDSIPGSGPYPVTIDALTQSLWIPPVGCSASTLSCSSPTVSYLRGGGVRWPGSRGW